MFLIVFAFPMFVLNRFFILVLFLKNEESILAFFYLESGSKGLVSTGLKSQLWSKNVRPYDSISILSCQTFQVWNPKVCRLILPFIDLTILSMTLVTLYASKTTLLTGLNDIFQTARVLTPHVNLSPSQSPNQNTFKYVAYDLLKDIFWYLSLDKSNNVVWFPILSGFSYYQGNSTLHAYQTGLNFFS